MDSVQIYQELAVTHDQQGQAQVRDRFLVLAADAALAAGRTEEAESLRARLLQLNPHHLLKPFTSLRQALESPDVKTYVEGLRRTYPPADAEQSLQKLRKDSAPPVSPAVDRTVTTLPRSGPSSPEWEEAKRTPTKAEAAPRAPSPPPPPRPAPVPPPPVPPPPPTPVIEEPIPFVPEPPPRNARVYPVAEAAMQPASEPAEDHADGAAGAGDWFAAALFYLVLLAAIALGAYTLLHPFL
jgi:hypothetical protein